MNKILLALVVSVMVTGCGYWCRDTVKQEILVSDRKHTAIVVERNCGAMAHYLTVVQIKERFLLFSRTQEVFQANDQHELKVEWQGEHILKIQCLDCSKRQVREAMKHVLDVDVNYTLQRGDVD